mgnify:CR=1 FL=1
MACDWAILEGEKEEKLLENIGRVRCVRQAPDGFIYVAVQNLGIVRLTPSS